MTAPGEPPFNHECDLCAFESRMSMPEACEAEDRKVRKAYWEWRAAGDREAVRLVREDVMIQFDPLFHAHLREALERVLDLTSQAVLQHEGFAKRRF